MHVHDHSGCAVATLRSVVAGQLLLNLTRLLLISGAFDRGDVPAVAGKNRTQTLRQNIIKTSASNCSDN